MIRSDCRITAKNWMPFVREMFMRFHQTPSPILDQKQKNWFSSAHMIPLTLHDVRTIKEKAARILGLKYSTLQLHTIDKGCFKLHFLISATVADHIFPVSPSSELQVSLRLGSKLYWSECNESIMYAR